jgi:nucleoside-diphosphate-sugar epimerase
VRDVAAATATLLAAPEEQVHGQAFNVGTGEQNYRIRELAELLSVETSCRVETAADAEPDARSYRVDFTKLLHTFPSLRFEWDASAGARELVSAYRDVGLTKAQFEGRRYVRLLQLRHLLDGGALDADLRWTDDEDAGAVHRD